MRDWADKWYVTLRFALYRDYRIVRMADAQGNMREGIFIPFIQNGITYDRTSYKGPRQTLRPIKDKRYIRKRKLVPCLSPKMREKMINEGVLSPDDKVGASSVGDIQFDYDFVDKYQRGR